MIILQKYGWQAAAEPASTGAGGHPNISLFIFLWKYGVKQLLQKMLLNLLGGIKEQSGSPDTSTLHSKWVMPGGLCCEQPGVAEGLG